MTINRRTKPYTEIPPNRAQPVQFPERADYMAGYMPGFGDDLNVMADEFNATASVVNNLEQSAKNSKDSAEAAALVANSASNIKGVFVPSQTNALQNETWIYEGAFWFALTDTSATPQESSGDWASLSKHSSTTNRNESGSHPASAIDGVREIREELVGGVVFPLEPEKELIVGDIVTSGATHLRVDGQIYAMSPVASGLVADFTTNVATIGGVEVSLEKITTLTNELSNDRTSQIIAGTYESNGFKLTTDQSVEGQGRLSTIIEAANNIVVSASGVGSTTDTSLSRVTIKGGGKNAENTVGYDLFAPDMSFIQNLRNKLSHVAIRDAEIGIHTNNGWHNTFTCYRVTDCNVGWKNDEALWLSGWGGSGQVSQGAYFAACNTGIDTTAMWNSTFINTVVEYCGTPIYERGNSNTYINTWLEGNALPVKIMRGSVFINGRGLDFDLSEITASIPEETLTLLTNRGAKFARRDLDKPEFNVNGNGVTDIRTPVSGTTWQHFRTAFSGSGERSSIEQTTYTGTTTAQARTESVPISSVQQLVSADGSQNLFGAVAFFAGKAASDGTPDTTHPFEEKWRVRFNGELRPAEDGLYDIASAGRRVNQIYLVNQPSVTSSRAYKNHEREIPAAVLRAVRKVPFKLFEYTDSIERKGGTYNQIGENGARTHVNPIIEDIIEAFESEGVDPWQFAVIRKVSWDSEPANYDDGGKILSKAIDAGERLELVETQWLALKIASILQ